MKGKKFKNYFLRNLQNPEEEEEEEGWALESSSESGSTSSSSSTSTATSGTVYENLDDYVYI